MTRRYPFAGMLVLMALFILAMPAASGASAGVLTTEITPLRNTVQKDQTAEYLLTITNPTATEQRVRLTFEGDIEWVFRTEPLSHALTGIKVPAHSTIRSTLKISLRQQDIPARQYRFGLLITSEESRMSAHHELLLNLRSGVSGSYRPAIAMHADFPTLVDPRGTAQLRLTLTNRNPLDIEELRVSSRGSLTMAETVTSLGPHEEKVVILDHAFDPVAPPQQDILLVTLFYNDESVGEEQVFYSTEAYSDILLTEDHDESFLRDVFTLGYFNDGNIDADKLVRRKIPFWKIAFTKTEPKGELRHDDGWTYTWRLNLEPQEEMKVVVRQDFRFAAATLVVVIAILALYFTLRSPVVLRKEASVEKRTEGGISEIKVVLHVKNRSTKRIDDVLVTDSVPDIIEVSKEFSVGTLKPSKILKHPKRGTVLRWHIDHLEPLEERIITYKVKAKLSIIGQVVLPAYVSKFKVDNKERIATSDDVGLSMPPKDR